MTSTTFEKTVPVAQEAYRTPCERAWADLCDCKDNPDVERVMASIGGWGAWAETPLTLLAFTGAFNGDPSAAARAMAKRAEQEVKG